VDENLTAKENFGSVADTTCGELAPYLLQLLFKMIPPCFLKHRKRPQSKEVNI